MSLLFSGSARSSISKEEDCAMTQICKLLIGTALTTLTATAAFAQTAAPAAGSLNPPAAPAAAGVDTPRETPDVAGLRTTAPAPQNLTAPGPTDPLAQKRDADAQANAEYRQQKKSAKSAYKGHVKEAKKLRKSDRQAANDQMKEQMQGVPAQSQGGNQRP